MTLEGRLTIDLYRAGRTVERAEISSSRPRRIARVFEAKPVDTALESIPLLFNVCAVAQGRAASQAVERALGSRRCSATEAARDTLVLIETAREHLMRIALDWPSFLNEETEKSGLVRISRILPNFREALFGAGAPFVRNARARADEPALQAALEELHDVISSLALGEPPETFLQRRSMAELKAWCREGRSCAARLLRKVIDSDWAFAATSNETFLPVLDDAVLAEKLDADGDGAFTALPSWDGAPRETTALSRHRDHPLLVDLSSEAGPGLLARLVARLVELAELPGEIEQLIKRVGRRPDPMEEETCSGDGTALAQVEAARGRLVHAIRIEQGTIARYRILAPTEWNFHPQGAAAQALRTLASADERGLETQARLLIDAVDPCVGYEVRVH